MEWRISNGIVLVTLLLLVTFCGEKNTVRTTVLTPLPFNYTEIDSVFGNCDSATCYQISLNYPVFEGDSLFDVQELVLSDFLFWQPIQQVGKPSISKLISEQETIYNDIVESGFENLNQLYLNLSLTIDFNDKGILSYSVSKDAFTGGAHPMYEARLMSYFVESELRPITWTDVFLADSLSKFVNLAKLSFFNFHALDINASANDQGFWFESGDFTLNESFSIQPEGIALMYNNYEVASYATGPTSLFLKWDEIKPWLTPRFAEVFK